MKTDKNGCSTTPNNCEQIEKFRHAGQEFIQYDYRTIDGELFSCVVKNIETARQRKDNWIQTHKG